MGGWMDGWNYRWMDGATRSKDKIISYWSLGHLMRESPGGSTTCISTSTDMRVHHSHSK